MIFYINPKSRHPVYLQIVYQVKRKIASGQLKSGDKLPTVSELAVNLILNPNTIQKAYSELSNEGLIYTRRGLGVFIAEITSPVHKEVSQQRIQEALDHFFTEAFLMGLTKEEIRNLMNQELKRFEKEGEQHA
ncbi:MAG: GntR family transcriptional regulator [Planctomycetota bacterium]